MEKICCVISGRYRKFKNPKISYVFEKKRIICIKCGNKNDKIFKKEESIEMLKILDSIKNI